MRKLLLITLIVPLLFACNQEKEGTWLTGTAENVEAGFFILGGPGGAKDSVFIAEDNTFEFDLGEIEKAYKYYILVDKDMFRFQITPNNTVDIYFDKTSFKESIAFAKDDADINNYLADKNRDKRLTPAGMETWKLVPAEFVKWADTYQKASMDLLKEQVKKNAEDVFWKTEEAEIIYGTVQIKDMYPMYHKYYAELEEDVELPDGYDSYKKNLDLTKEEYLGSSAYTNYIASVIGDAISAKVESQDVDRTLVGLELAQDMLLNEKVRNNFWITSVMGKMSFTPLTELKASLDFVRKNCTDEVEMAKLEKEYDAWMKLAEGQPAFDFVGKDLEGNDVKFSDFKGKYVYVDVWATWCGPCKYEIPFLKTLEKDYHGRNIVFVSYSIDEDKQAWLDFVPENELGGVQIIGEKAWSSAMPVFYKVRGVPTFMFFGPDGKIIDVKMTRPSNQETRDKFDSYSDL